MEIGQEMYRYVETVFEGGIVSIDVDIYTVRKITPCGIRVAGKSISDWLIERGYVKTRFVLTRDCNKRFAWPTKEEALTSFIARKRRQLSILEHQTDIAKAALRIALEMKS
jgi:hypothetical protein